MKNHLELLSIKETCLYITNLLQAKKFYENVLGLDLYSESDHYLFYKIGSSMLLLFDPNHTKTQNHLPPHYGQGNQHFAFEVAKPQYEQWKKYLISQSIEIEHELTWNNGKKSFYFRDPEHNLLEILEPNVWD